MDPLLKRIQSYLNSSGMPPTLFGRRAVNDPRLVGDLRRGREPRPPLVARVDAFIAAQRNAQ